MVMMTSSSSSPSSSSASIPLWRHRTSLLDWPLSKVSNYNHRISLLDENSVRVDPLAHSAIPLGLKKSVEKLLLMPINGPKLKFIQALNPRTHFEVFTSQPQGAAPKHRLYDKRSEFERHGRKNSNNSSCRRRKTSQTAIEHRNMTAKKETEQEKLLVGKGSGIPMSKEEAKIGSAMTTIVVFRRPQESSSHFGVEDKGNSRSSLTLVTRSYMDSEGKVEEDTRQSCSSSITQPAAIAAGNGSYNRSAHTLNNNPCSRPSSSSHSLMPSTTTTVTLVSNTSTPTPDAEKFLLQQQLKRLNQQNKTSFQINPTNRPIPHRYSSAHGEEEASQSHHMLTDPSNKDRRQVYSLPIEGLPSSKKSDVDSKPNHHHHHHHHRQNSHQKKNQKSTEFPVLVNGQLPEPSASHRMENNTNFSCFPSSNNNSQSKSQPVKKISPRLSSNGYSSLPSPPSLTSSSRLSMPLVMTAPKVIKVPGSAIVKQGEKETNGQKQMDKSSGHRLSSAKLLDAVKKASVDRQDNSKCLPYNGLVNDDRTASSSSSSEGQIVAVRISVEAQRQFELGVTGGSDLSHPAIVSRICLNGANVADSTQPHAITSIPLNEGDQLLKINGRDVDKWTQAEVQDFLKELKTTGSDILLHIKPNVYRCCSVLVDEEDGNSQTNSQADSTQKRPNGSATTSLEVHQQHVADSVPRSDQLAQSLVLLKEAIESGRVVKQFEQLYRKKPGMSMNDSKLPENAGKNRYRDVCPYDLTRVLLKDSPNGDYINACHVNMEIPSSGIVNRYIATQGPLPNTTVDFWHMVWEQSATTIAMLTTLIEKGRVKCHQYWPDQPKEAMELGCGSPLQVTNMSERVEAHCHYRELAIRHKISREERLVTQMQYTAWPDHGVPENPQHFIEFVNEVRKARNGSLDPLIVHCSAGIGRTGVLILMETSACQIEANEPVYPLDSMRLMRDQRAMLIQTAEQYTFVCESILRAYNEQSVKPLAEYQKCR